MGPKYRFPSYIDLTRCRKEVASALNDFGNQWCKLESVKGMETKYFQYNV